MKLSNLRRAFVFSKAASLPALLKSHRLLSNGAAEIRKERFSRKRSTQIGASRSLINDTSTLDWDDDNIRLSDKLRRRLGHRSKDVEPVVAADIQVVQIPAPAQPVRLQQNGDLDAPPFLELRDRRPKTGEALIFQGSEARSISNSAKVKSADYIASSLNAKSWPAATLPEIAVIGRSNVGKSSLINMLTGRKDLALVSKSPGKTRTINHFLINKAWYLVDLPGYGYAKTSKESRFTWGKYTQQFFLERTSLVQVLLLVDATVPLQAIDLDCAQWLFENAVPFSIVYTKLDKRKKKCLPPRENIENFQAALRNFMPVDPGSVATSASEKNGRDELLKYLAALRAHVVAPGVSAKPQS